MNKNTTTPTGTGANTPKAEQPKTSQAPASLTVIKAQEVKEQTPNELRQEIERLKGIIAKSPEDFESKIKYYERKQELIKRLRVTEESYKRISDFFDEVSKEAAEDIFQSENFKLTIGKKRGYNDDEVMKFSDPVIIGDLLIFILDKLGRKREKIEKEIAQ